MPIEEGLLRVTPLTPNYRLEALDVWEVFVKYVKYDRSIIHSWFFDNEQDAKDKVKFVWDKWIEPPLNEYKDICFYEQVKVYKRVINE